MSARWLVVAGERYLTLELVAECYELEVSLVRELYELDVFGAGVPVEQTIAVASATLDRLGNFLRLHRLTGADPSAIALLLPPLPEA